MSEIIEKLNSRKPPGIAKDDSFVLEIEDLEVFFLN